MAKKIRQEMAAQARVIAANQILQRAVIQMHELEIENSAADIMKLEDKLANFFKVADWWIGNLEI